MLNSVDPLALALLKSGGAGGVGAGPVLVQPPEQKMRMMMAQQLMGADPASARTKGEGLARFAQQIAGAYLAKQGMDEAKAQRDSDSGLMAAVLRSQDKTPTTYTDDADQQQTITWNKPDASTMTTIMAQGSPQMQQQALAMALSDRQRQADIAAKTVTMLTPEQVRAAGLPPGAYQRDAFGKVDQIAKAPLFGMPGPVGGDAAGGTPGAPPAGAGTMTVPKAPAATPTGPVPMSPQARATIGVESGGNADATNPNSSATGPAQFIDSTWLSMMQKHAPGLIQGKSKDEILAMRSDPEVAGQMVDAYAGENGAALRAAGLEPTPQDLYFSHVFGSGGAINMLKADQRAPAASLNSRATVEANRPLFFEKNGRPRTVAELRQMLGDRFSQNMPQETAAADPAAVDMAAGVADPARAMPPGSAAVPDAQPPAAQQPVQVAQANTGTMTDAAPAAVQSPAQQFRRPMNLETGQLAEFELPVGPNGEWPRLPDGRIDISKARPYQKPSFSTVDLGTSTGVLDGNTGEVARTIPKDVAGEAAARKQGETQAQRQADAPKSVQQADLMLSAIDGTLNHPGFSWGTGKSSWTTHLPGTQAYDFGRRVEQLQGQAFLQAFESMKGGGAISEMEGKKAQAAIARLDNAQTEEGFRQALGELRGIVTAARERAVAQGGGTVPGAAQQAGAAPPPAASSAPALPPGFQMVE